MPAPLVRRREILAETLGQVDPCRAVLSEGIVGAGTAWFEQVVRQGHEGVMAKHLAGRYLPGIWALRQQEQQRRAAQARRMRSRRQPIACKNTIAGALSAYRALELGRNPDVLAAELTACFIAAGQKEADARRNAQRFAEESARAARCLQ